MFPSNWSNVRLGDIAVTVTSGSRDWAQYYAESGSIFLRMTNLRRDGIGLKLDDLKFVNVKSDSSDGKRTSLIAGDILISITAELGKIGLIPNNFGLAFINQHTALVRLSRSKAEPIFVAYLLSSKKMNQQINRLNDAGAKAGLNLPTIRSIPLSLPPLPEQTKIAQILSTWDKAIETVEKLIENSQQQKKALIQQLLTGKKRFKEFGEPVNSAKLSELIRIKHGYAFSGEYFQSEKADYILLTPGNFHVDKRLYFGANTKYYNGHVEEEYVLHNGDLLIVMTDLTKQMAILGNAVILESDSLVLHNQRIGKVEFLDQSSVDKSYLCLLLNSDLIRSHVKATASGTTVRHTSPKKILEIEIPLPPIKEQKKIAEIISVETETVCVCSKQLDSLKREKKALMQQLLTGKRRVNVDSVENVAEPA